MRLRCRKIEAFIALNCLLLLQHPPTLLAEESQPIDEDDTGQFKRFQQEPIFIESELCTTQCGTRSHTLCKTLEVPTCDKYRVYEIYEVNYVKRTDLKEMILLGHNGLRDRIAQKMNVANMVELTWDEELARMSVAYFMQCQAFEDDPCTQNVFPDDTKRIDYYEKDLSKWVVQNRFNLQSEFFPTNFIEVALRTWYFEKDFLPAPKSSFDENIQGNVGVVKGENNFTHMANPLTFRVGCSLARIDDSYSLVCYYYPFYHTANNETVFLNAEPTSICPAYFPLPDEYFQGICTDSLESLHTDAGPAVLVSVGASVPALMACIVLYLI